MLDNSGSTEVRLRLHPYELDSTFVPQKLKRLHSKSELLSDIKWAGVVLSPISTVLLEAALLGRAIGLISSEPQVKQLRQEIIFYKQLDAQLTKTVTKVLNEIKITDALGFSGEFCRQTPTPSIYIAEHLMSICETSKG
jgi:hypothetical protein